MTDYVVPWARFEQIDIPATGLKTSSPSIWRNSSPYPLTIERVLIDSESVTTTSVRFGLRKKRLITDNYVSTLALQNSPALMNVATDGAKPLWKFRKPVLAQRGQQFLVELEDTVGGSARVTTVLLYGYRACQPSEPVIFTDQVSVPSSGKITVTLKTDESGPVMLLGLQLWINETGTAAKLRGMKVRVTGGGLPDWMDRTIRGSLLFPDVNPAAAFIWTPPGDGLVISPGDTFEAEFHDTSGGAVTVYLGMVGYTPDRRS